jgi:hypothetical protein
MAYGHIKADRFRKAGRVFGLQSVLPMSVRSWLTGQANGLQERNHGEQGEVAKKLKIGKRAGFWTAYRDMQPHDKFHNCLFGTSVCHISTATSQHTSFFFLGLAFRIHVPVVIGLMSVSLLCRSKRFRPIAFRAFLASEARGVLA